MCVEFVCVVLKYMPCYHPLQVEFSLSSSGKKELSFSSSLAYEAVEAFQAGLPLPPRTMSLPCGSCMGCRLEKSRQWALRCVHESSLYSDNCFLTLTYSPENLPVDGSLRKDDLQRFWKRLRRAYPESVIRYFACGEYGEMLERPHYHACVFGFDFPDKRLFKSGPHPLFVSSSFSSIWGLGHCSIGSLTFESAAYVARYCTKKVNGSKAEEHYQGRQPEFSAMSLKPGIGSAWYDKWKSDCFPSDYLIVNGYKCKPPRYYDKKLEAEDVSMYERIKQSRAEIAESSDDNGYRRLLDREKCQQRRFQKLLRKMEGVQ